jgi:hypothetical protein
MPERIHFPPYNAAPFIEVTLESGREIWSTAYTAEMTYSGLLEGLPTRAMNARCAGPPKVDDEREVNFVRDRSANRALPDRLSAQPCRV